MLSSISICFVCRGSALYAYLVGKAQKAIVVVCTGVLGLLARYLVDRHGEVQEITKGG